jgi:hypothetical protein
MNNQATFYTYNLYLSISLMVIVASIYLRFYIEVRGSTFLLTPTPPKFLLTPTPQPWLKFLYSITHFSASSVVSS